MKTLPRRFAGLFLAFAALCVAGPAAAQGMLKMSTSRSVLIELPEDAKTVVVANPTHLTALLDNPRLMILVPGEPGTTSLTVLGRKGDVIYDRDVVISAIGPSQVRITKSCAAAGAQGGCAPTTILDCTDGCVTVSAPPAVAAPQDGSIQGSMPAGAAPAPGNIPAGMPGAEVKLPDPVDPNLQ